MTSVDPSTTVVHVNPRRVALGSLVTHVGAGISRAFFDEPSGVPVLRSNNVKDGEVVLDGLKYWHRVDPNGADLERVKPRVGDLLINFVNGSQRELGKAAVFRGELQGCIASTNFFIVRVKEDELLPDYLNYFLQSTEYRRWLFRTCGFSGQGSFNQAQIRSLRVPVSSIDQQKGVVAILGELDATRRTVNRMIDAKRTFKRGLMQQLLTGQKRFPEFQSRPWVKTTVGSVLEEVVRPVIWDEDANYTLVSVRRRAGGLFLRERRKGADIKVKALNQLRKGDLLISTRQVAHGAIALVPTEFDGAHVSGEYMVLVPKQGMAILPEYFDHLTRLPRMYHTALLASYGVDIEKLTFNPEWYLESSIEIPPTVEEQRRIADVINALDREIELIAAQRDQFENFRRALLSKLLSGELTVPNS